MCSNIGFVVDDSDLVVVLCISNSCLGKVGRKGGGSQGTAASQQHAKNASGGKLHVAARYNYGKFYEVLYLRLVLLYLYSFAWLTRLLIRFPYNSQYNVVINAWAKSGSKGAAAEAEKLLSEMHRLNELGDRHVKPNVVTYGAVIDAYAKSGERGAAARADTLLANMIHLHQMDPITNADLQPNTYVFNTVINCWAKSKEPDAASKAEEMLVAMGRLHTGGVPNLKPDAFTYTAVIDVSLAIVVVVANEPIVCHE